MRFVAFILLFISLDVHCFDWQGHRGARGLYPENTIGSMETALRFPVTTLELDVVVSKDQEVVVSHEPWMSSEICLHPEKKEIKDREFNLFKMTYKEIQAFDCGSKVHPRFPQQLKVSVGKPTLKRLLDVIEPRLRNRSVQYSIEIKSTPEDEKMGFQPDVKTFSELVLKVILERVSVERFMIQSFDWRVLQYIHKNHPNVKLVALVEGPFEVSPKLKELGFVPAVFSPEFTHLTKEKVDELKRQTRVIPWTVNELQEMKRLMEMGVDGIITDYPNKINLLGSLACKKDETFWEGKCRPVPKNAEASTSHPGWTCRPGHVQKRSQCLKIKLPRKAKLLPDGKSWECKEGHERYRGTCVRKK